jgi:hypothetical protein
MNSHPIVEGLRQLQFPMKNHYVTNQHNVPRTDTGVPKVRSLRRVELLDVREIGKLERYLRNNACLEFSARLVRVMGTLSCNN